MDQRTDIWSLGVVLCEMLTGRLPFRGEGVHSLLYNVVHEPPAIDEAGIPAPLVTVVRKALAKDLGSRYTRAENVAADLGDGGSGQIAPLITQTLMPAGSVSASSGGIAQTAAPSRQRPIFLWFACWDYWSRRWRSARLWIGRSMWYGARWPARKPSKPALKRPASITQRELHPNDPARESDREHVRQLLGIKACMRGFGFWPLRALQQRGHKSFSTPPSSIALACAAAAFMGRQISAGKPDMFLFKSAGVVKL